MDLAQVGPFLNLMFEDDAAYRNLPASSLRKTIVDQGRHTVPEIAPKTCPSAYAENWKRGSGDIPEFVIAHYAALDGATILDVGCQYGSSSMEIARLLRSLNASIPILAFDCGLAGALAPLNIHNNGFSAEIQFRPEAVGSLDKFVLVHQDLAHSEDNRIVNPLSQRGSLAMPVRCVTIDTMLDRAEISLPLVAKIDTQGAEPEVLKGAKRLIERRQHAFVLEFTPHAMEPRTEPESFLYSILANHHVFDLGIEHTSGLEITKQSAHESVMRVRGSKHKWTDLLALAKGFEPNEAIRARLVT